MLVMMLVCALGAIGITLLIRFLRESAFSQRGTTD